MSCPACKEPMKFKGYRPKDVVSLLGVMTLERGYYPCKHCHAGHFPWDEILRLSPKALTPGAEEVVTLLGIQDAFGKVADRTLSKATGLRLSESTVQRTTEAAGQRLAERLSAGAVFGPKTVWPWHKDLDGKTCALHQPGCHGRDDARTGRGQGGGAHGLRRHDLQSPAAPGP